MKNKLPTTRSKPGPVPRYDNPVDWRIEGRVDGNRLEKTLAHPALSGMTNADIARLVEYNLGRWLDMDESESK